MTSTTGCYATPAYAVPSFYHYCNDAQIVSLGCWEGYQVRGYKCYFFLPEGTVPTPPFPSWYEPDYDCSSMEYIYSTYDEWAYVWPPSYENGGCAGLGTPMGWWNSEGGGAECYQHQVFDDNWYDAISGNYGCLVYVDDEC